jgi:hypothetical protein
MPAVEAPAKGGVEIGRAGGGEAIGRRGERARRGRQGDIELTGAK